VIRNKTEYNDVKGMKEESGGKKVDQFLRDFYVMDLIHSFILSQLRNL